MQQAGASLTVLLDAHEALFELDDQRSFTGTSASVGRDLASGGEGFSLERFRFDRGGSTCAAILRVWVLQNIRKRLNHALHIST
jgi:hypothetical protein